MEPLDLTKLKGNKRPLGHLTDLRATLYKELERTDLNAEQRVELLGMLTALTLEAKKQNKKRWQSIKKSATGKKRGRPTKMSKIWEEERAKEAAKRNKNAPVPSPETEAEALQKFLQTIEPNESETTESPAI